MPFRLKTGAPSEVVDEGFVKRELGGQGGSQAGAREPDITRRVNYIDIPFVPLSLEGEGQGEGDKLTFFMLSIIKKNEW